MAGYKGHGSRPASFGTLLGDWHLGLALFGLLNYSHPNPHG